jgi:thymidylate synthase (FAD)
MTNQITATYIDHMGSDLSVVNAARVSFGKKSDWEFSALREGLLERDAKLINYLAKHRHISPFGHAFASFHVKAPIFVARQLVKHKFLRWNEISRRYVDDKPEFYVPDVWRGRSEDKKQGSDGIVDLEAWSDRGGDFVNDTGEGTLIDYLWMKKRSDFEAYDLLIKAGVAPEQARMVLPTSQLTEWIWSGSLDAFADMCRLRCKTDTQYETRLVADQISEKMSELFPVSWSALMGETE